jgi:predicted enzyme related to lactoylglutathione lyase
MALVGELMELILYVEDMPSQVAFYQDVLGLRVKYPPGDNDLAIASWVEFESGTCTLALHSGGKRRFGEDAPKFVFRVADILAAHKTLLERGVAIGDIFQAAPGVWVSNASDPEGNQFSLESHD